eukprot:gb/GECH01011619.1/.p1 GENE.gb/GECH01011619.1/~~gb/GECH01011619.1/.p1  ORF type:complete len:204 (+),score=44.76 gb/GECH01011619.1/:1-612(+)
MQIDKDHLITLLFSTESVIGSFEGHTYQHIANEGAYEVFKQRIDEIFTNQPNEPKNASAFSSRFISEEEYVNLTKLFAKENDEFILLESFDVLDKEERGYIPIAVLYLWLCLLVAVTEHCTTHYLYRFGKSLYAALYVSDGFNRGVPVRSIRQWLMVCGIGDRINLFEILKKLKLKNDDLMGMDDFLVFSFSAMEHWDSTEIS